MIGLTKVEKKTCPLWLAAFPGIKGESGLNISIHFSLFPHCGCNVIADSGFWCLNFPDMMVHSLEL